jgi:beta-ureidopropionase / N-carbamoyl-L-amino-acid hydrolase
MDIRIDSTRLWGDLQALAEFSAPSPGGGVTRRAWSREYFAAERWLIGQFEAAGLTVEVDAARNVWGKWEEGSLPAVVAGSHVDSVPSGGAFDGCLGVLAGLEAVRALRQTGFRPKRQVWIVAWSEEEGSAFGQGLLGSRAFVGELDLDGVKTRRNTEGKTFEQVIEDTGHRLADLAALPARIQNLAAYLELHIEQGPVLERERLSVGVVTDIVGIESGSVCFTGQSNHAGGTPMEVRQDAAVGAARGVVEARRLAREYGVRATSGQLSVLPGATNVISGRATFSLDARHRERRVLAEYMKAVHASCQSIADEEGLKLDYDYAYSLNPVPLDEGIGRLLAELCERLGVGYQRMVSGAGHDAMVVAPRVPTGMLFVPSHNGVSHAPEEYSSPEDCALGAQILAHTLAQLSSEQGS